MRITKTFDWNRRDFNFDAVCEHCDNEESYAGGYDDDNYYNNVVPSFKCSSCGESSLSKVVEGPTIKVIPRYDPNKVM